VSTNGYQRGDINERGLQEKEWHLQRGLQSSLILGALYVRRGRAWETWCCSSAGGEKRGSVAGWAGACWEDRRGIAMASSCQPRHCVRQSPSLKLEGAQEHASRVGSSTTASISPGQRSATATVCARSGLAAECVQATSGLVFPASGATNVARLMLNPAPELAVGWIIYSRAWLVRLCTSGRPVLSPSSRCAASPRDNQQRQTNPTSAAMRCYRAAAGMGPSLLDIRRRLPSPLSNPGEA
jgi:hypothetical protein